MAAGDARGRRELGELVTSGTGAVPALGSVIESRHHGVSIFFSHRNKQSHVKSITPWVPVLFITFFRREKKPQQNVFPESDSFTLVVSEEFYTFSVLTFPHQISYPSAI